MSEDAVAAKDSETTIEIVTRIVLGTFNGILIIDDNDIFSSRYPALLLPSMNQ
jgi:hypothetical protein